jgi:uncharacterized protein (TIGR02594 family)
MVIKLNDRGLEVRKLQLLLNSQFASGLKIDGQFGPSTHKALLAFQKSKGLTPDGQVGPKTRAALGLKPVSTPMTEEINQCLITAPWMEIAAAELGVHGDTLPGQHNARILEYHKTTTLKATTDEVAWCSSFVNWVMIQAGRKGTNNAQAKSWLNWGTAVSPPMQGAVVVIKGPPAPPREGFHVGFFVSLSATHIRILGGNQSNQVRYSNYPLTTYEVKGYRQ